MIRNTFYIAIGLLALAALYGSCTLFVLFLSKVTSLSFHNGGIAVYILVQFIIPGVICLFAASHSIGKYLISRLNGTWVASKRSK